MSPALFAPDAASITQYIHFDEHVMRDISSLLSLHALEEYEQSTSEKLRRSVLNSACTSEMMSNKIVLVSTRNGQIKAI